MKIPIILFITILSYKCFCQNLDIHKIEWGENRCDVQMSIGFGNHPNTAHAGSRIPLYIYTRNLSTNHIYIIQKPVDFYTLTNNYGQIYQARSVIGTNNISIDMNLPWNPDVSPGEIREWPVEIKFPEKIGIGEYTFCPITEDIKTVGDNVCVVGSNSLNIKIIK
jgi:hypothetical protein